MATFVAFPFKVRQAMRVSDMVAQELINNTSRGHGFVTVREVWEWENNLRPMLLSIAVSKDSDSVTFRYESGFVVRIHMFDMSRLNSHLRGQCWVVYRAVVRYYPAIAGSFWQDDTKVEEVWDAARLIELERYRPWGNPRVEQKVESSVGIFVNWGTMEGYCTVDPTTTQDGHYDLVEEVTYEVTKPGDKERAKEAAGKRLWEILDGE